MATLPFHNVVALDGWWDDDSSHTFNLAAAADASVLTIADEGKLMTIDATGPNKMKPVGDGDPIMGRLLKVEQRTTGAVGSVAMRFVDRFFLLAADAAIVGDPVVGSLGGTPNGSRGGWCKKDTSANAALNMIRVWEKGTDAATGFTYVVIGRM